MIREESNYPRTPDPEAALNASTSQVDLRNKALLSNNNNNDIVIDDVGETSSGAHSRSAGAISKSTESASPSKNKNKSANSDFIPLTHPPPTPVEDKDASKSRTNNTANVALPRLIHPFLHKIPMQIRYVVYGTLSSALYMVLYNKAVEVYGHFYVPSTIYAAVYLIFIPIQHAMAAAMVFGWPDRYFASLTSNVPVGLSAIALGAYLTAYLDQIKFNDDVANMLEVLGWWNLAAVANSNNGKDGDGSNKNEIYTSFFVLVITSFWSFILSVFVNAPAEEPDKKEV